MIEDILPIKLYDSYLKKDIIIEPQSTVTKNTLKMYSCGPTVYNYMHIGNLRASWLPDTIAKIATMAGWEVQWISNITDVGHLVGDGDNGHDKLEVGAKRESKSVKEIVDFYTENFLEQASAINLDIPTGVMFPKASDYIQEQMIITLVLLREGKAYATSDGIYFDSKRNEDLYSIISKQFNIPHKEENSPTENINYTGRNIIGQQSKSPEDFALWKFVDENSLQKWRFADFPAANRILSDITAQEIEKYKQSKENIEFFNFANSSYFNHLTWGCPGWHTECVAMIVGILESNSGEVSTSIRTDFDDLKSKEAIIDLHFGGEDHIDLHHKNEILQSEALGFHLSKYWVHNKFVLVDNHKISKSLENSYLILGNKEKTGFESIEEKGFDPLAYRMMFMEHHYKEQMNFSWDKLEQSQNRLYNLRKEIAKLRSFAQSPDLEMMDDNKYEATQLEWLKILLDDLNLPKFLDIYQEFTKYCVNRIETQGKLAIHDHFNLSKFGSSILQLKLFELDLPHEILEKADQRWKYRKEKQFEKADTLRQEIATQNWQIDDYSWGWGIWYKKYNNQA